MEKLILARLKKAGVQFELSIDGDAALAFKNGQGPLNNALKSEQIFSDAKKGLVAKDEDLEKAFETTNQQKIAEIIIKKGEIQLSSEHRNKERDQRKKQLIDMIHRMAINPTNGLPHPITRIEAALDQAKIHLSEHKSVEDQVNDIISKLRPIIPLKVEMRVLIITVAASDIGKTNHYIRNNSKVLKEDWNSDGSWRTKVEIPAGVQQDIIDKLNGLTHGNIQIDIEND